MYFLNVSSQNLIQLQNTSLIRAKKNLIECVTKWSLAIYYSFKLSLLGYVLSEQKFSLSTSFSATFSHSMSSLFVCPGQINCLCPLRRKPEQARKGQARKQVFILYSVTLESGIDVGQGINVGPGKLVKKNKRRALNKRRA